MDDLVTSFSALGLSGRVPLKLGHEGPDVRDDPMTQFAMGWVKRIYREGERLMADMDVPDRVNKFIREGLLKFVSVELLRNVRADSRVIPMVLDAVALLGADQPAVGILKELTALSARRSVKFHGGTRVAFRRAVNFSEDKTMSDEAIKALQEQLAALTKVVNQKDEETKAEFKRRDEAEAKKDAEHKKELCKIKRERIDERFNRAIEAGDILPAKREQFMKFARVDVDANVESLDLKDVDTYIQENKEKTKLKRKDPTSGGGSADDEDEKGLRADQVLAKRAEKLCYSRNQDPKNLDHYTRAVTEVLRSDATLAESYKYMPDTEYRPAA